MNYKEQCDLGRIAKYCEEGRIEIDVDNRGKVVVMKGYTKARRIQDGLFKTN